MKAKVWTVVIVLIMGFVPAVFAQPYTLDEKIVPTRLELKEMKGEEGTLGLIVNQTIEKEAQYYYVVGQNMFQPVDVYIFSNYGNPDFQADLARINWGQVEDSQTTGNSENGIINFKFRVSGDFGLKIHPGIDVINYTIYIHAAPAVKEYLGSAFRKATNADLNGEETGKSKGAATAGSSNGNGSSNIVLYVILGVALLVIGFLLSRVMNKRQTTVLLTLFTLFCFGNSFGQMDGETTWEDADMYEDWLRSEPRPPSSEETVSEGIKRLGDVAGRIKKFTELYESADSAYGAYEGLSECMSATRPPGMPRIPSFCETDDCDNCFREARANLNQNRYVLEQLRTIYSCTKNFTDRAIKFGDNVAGIHGVTGLAWQFEKNKIEKSVKDLQKAYDDKLVELLRKQLDALNELNMCEAAHGIPDWYDRFGYLYFEFSKMNYKRRD